MQCQTVKNTPSSTALNQSMKLTCPRTSYWRAIRVKARRAEELQPDPVGTEAAACRPTEFEPAGTGNEAINDAIRVLVLGGVKREFA